MLGTMRGTMLGVPPAMLILLIACAAAVIAIVWGYVAARAAGMSERQPVCSVCLYRLGGWSSPVCPECGSDVRVVGVRTGSRVTRTALSWLALAIAFAGVGPLAFSAADWIFAHHDIDAHARFESIAAPAFSMTVETSSQWTRFPHRSAYDTTLVFTTLPDNANGGEWRNGRYFGDPPGRSQTIAYDQASGPPTRATLARAIADALSKPADDALVVKHTSAAAEIIEGLAQTQNDGRFRSTFLLNCPSPSFATTSGGGGGGTGAGAIASLATLLAMLLFTGVAVYLVSRCCPRGRRVPFEGEWSAPVTIGATADGRV